MTIGIALSGPNAGLCLFKALAAVERISRGSIGGFVSFAVITADGQLLRAQTQDGGTTTLFGGEDPPAEICPSAPGGADVERTQPAGTPVAVHAW
ncbi:DUF6963 family protein [uncultured Roseibium sp.]|uniref:DUF6963 family protein n=1 Tax=uncultured Roseibium sp. TaxID=1936171 RepID=UPI003216420B